MSIVWNALSPSLRGYLAEHGIHNNEALNRLVDNNVVEIGGNVIAYYRPHVNGEHGYKYHDVPTGRRWNYPSGWRHSETKPVRFQHWNTDYSRLFVTEGESDGLSLHTNTLEDVLVAPGANSFPNEWSKYLYEYDEVYVVADNDSAGNTLCTKIAKVYPKVRRIRIPERYKDWSEYAANEGASESHLEELVKRSETIPTPSTSLQLTRKFKPRHGHKYYDQRSHSIIDVIGKDLTLKRVGSEYVGHCPFHEDTTASLFVNPKKNLYYCHACDHGGDTITYIMKTRNCDYKEAVKQLGE